MGFGRGACGSRSGRVWLLASLLFVIPLAIAIAALMVKHPGTGGIYLWTREDYGPWHGFLAFWVYWMGIALLFPTVAMFYSSTAAYCWALPMSISPITALTS